MTKKIFFVHLDILNLEKYNFICQKSYFLNIELNIIGQKIQNHIFTQNTRSTCHSS